MWSRWSPRKISSNPKISEQQMPQSTRYQVLLSAIKVQVASTWRRLHIATTPPQHQSATGRWKTGDHRWSRPANSLNESQYQQASRFHELNSFILQFPILGIIFLESWNSCWSNGHRARDKAAETVKFEILRQWGSAIHIDMLVPGTGGFVSQCSWNGGEGWAGGDNERAVKI